MRCFLFAIFLVVACATGVAADSFEDAASVYDSGEYTRAVHLFRPLAEKGNVKAQLQLGIMYDMGLGVSQDYQEALKWYRKAAKQGLPQAQFNLGVMYAMGQGVPPDSIRAHMWYNVAATTPSGDHGKVARAHRDTVALQMTAVQIKKAQEMARHCQDTQFKECD
jgi:TPR repeat protein